MKRLTVFTLIAVSMLPACTNEALQEKAANQNYSFTARTDAGIKTRTCLGEVLSNETYPLLWEKGDRIIIAQSGKPATSYYETQGQDNDVAEFRFISGLEGNEMPPEKQHWRHFIRRMPTSLQMASTQSTYLKTRHIEKTTSVPEQCR